MKQKIIHSNLRDYKLNTYDNWIFMDNLKKIEKSIFIIDSDIFNLYKDKLFFDIHKEKIVLFESKEENKNFEGVLRLLEEVLKVAMKAKRETTIISFGGGITQDVSGFIASILYRGVNWIYVPTTLLAQVDSCIGSKTSLNFKHYKNLLGTFYPPNEIYLTPLFIGTLKDSDFNSGMGEVIKFRLMDLKNNEDIEKISSNIKVKKTDYEKLLSLIEKSLEIKLSFMEGDEFDKGRRNFLNYGHTLGHAIETVSEYEIPHGTAVIIGMIYAYIIARNRGYMKKEIVEKINNILMNNIKINLKESYFNKEELLDCIKNDKKVIGDKLTLILQNDDFEMIKIDDFEVEEFERGLEELKKTLIR